MMPKDAAKSTPQRLTADEAGRAAARESLRDLAMEMRRQEEFDFALELLVGKEPLGGDPTFAEKSREARRALLDFVKRGPFARPPRKPVRVSRAMKLARALAKANVALYRAMDAFSKELREYASGPVLYPEEHEVRGPLLFNIAFFGTDPRVMEPGARVGHHQTTRFRLEAIGDLTALILKSLPPDKGGRTNLEIQKNGKRMGQLVLEAGEMFSAFSTEPVTGTGTGPFMAFCIALLALAQRPVEREERRLRDFVEYGAPRIREMSKLLQELQDFDPNEAIRGGRAHPYFQVGDRVEDLRREIQQGPPARKKKRSVVKA